MARRSKLAASQPKVASQAPTLVYSGATTPLSSALPSTYASEDEDNIQPAKFDVSTIPIHKLSLGASTPIHQDSCTDGRRCGGGHRAPPGQRPAKPFRFLDLPSELRLKIYAFHFEGTDAVADLTPENFKKVYKKLFLLRTCHKIYMEASYFYYSTHTFRIFPTYPGRFFKTRRPLLARLSKNQRATMTSMELRLGPGFNKPPRCWVVNDALGLKDCVSVRKISVFVQLDPSLSWLDGFRKPGFYETFSRNLLDDILKETPNVEVVEFDGYESVRKTCPIMEALMQTTREHGKKIAWGPRNGWTDAADGTDDKSANNQLLVAAIRNYDTRMATVVVSPRYSF